MKTTKKVLQSKDKKITTQIKESLTIDSSALEKKLDEFLDTSGSILGIVFSKNAGTIKESTEKNIDNSWEMLKSGINVITADDVEMNNALTEQLRFALIDF